jgi:hypothetical protein
VVDVILVDEDLEEEVHTCQTAQISVMLLIRGESIAWSEIFGRMVSEIPISTVPENSEVGSPSQFPTIDICPANLELV